MISRLFFIDVYTHTMAHFATVREERSGATMWRNKLGGHGWRSNNASSAASDLRRRQSARCYDTSSSFNGIIQPQEAVDFSDIATIKSLTARNLSESRKSAIRTGQGSRHVIFRNGRL